ncbi:MAG: type II secretion system protein [Candidatus Sungbacteria bacterium]|nr:type II secretion system protein [bacterium]MDZ4260032.1 type II secretion system protein [Candidatus Sungbacteria bacterium]
MRKKISSTQGFGLIELVIVTAIASALLAAFLQIGILSIQLLRTQKQDLEATLLAQQGIEVVRSLRDESWTANIAPLTDGISYYPSVENSKWKLGTVPPALINDLYTRQIIFNQVFRDALDRIAPSGTADPDTRKVTSQVTWNGRQIDLVTYLTNFQEQLTQSTESKVISFEGATTDTDIISFPSQNAGDGDPAQSFTTLASAISVTRIDALLRRTTSSPSDIYAEIRTSPLGTILGTSHLITASTIADTIPAWVEFRFAPPVSLNASTQYYIRLRSVPSSTTAASGSAGVLQWSYLQSGSSPYSGGMAHRSIERLANPLDPGEQLDEYDFGFKVYALQ